MKNKWSGNGRKIWKYDNYFQTNFNQDFPPRPSFKSSNTLYVCYRQCAAAIHLDVAIAVVVVATNSLALRCCWLILLVLCPGYDHCGFSKRTSESAEPKRNPGKSCTTTPPPPPHSSVGIHFLPSVVCPIFIESWWKFDAKKRFNFTIFSIPRGLRGAGNWETQAFEKRYFNFIALVWSLPLQIYTLG